MDKLKKSTKFGLIVSAVWMFVSFFPMLLMPWGGVYFVIFYNYTPFAYWPCRVFDGIDLFSDKLLNLNIPVSAAIIANSVVLFFLSKFTYKWIRTWKSNRKENPKKALISLVGVVLTVMIFTVIMLLFYIYYPF